MLNRREKKKLPGREQNIVDECEEPKSIKEITHLLLTNSISNTPSGLYIYNPVTEILTSLDDDLIGRLPGQLIIKKGTSSSIKPLKHIPTWDQMIEDGEVKDMRTKKEDEVEESVSADTQQAKVAEAPVRRSLGF
jgi:hypothetical protein